MHKHLYVASLAAALLATACAGPTVPLTQEEPQAESGVADDTLTQIPDATATLPPPVLSEIHVETGDDGSLSRAQWNRGEVRRMTWTSDSELVVTAANGYFAYQMDGLTETQVESDGMLDLAEDAEELVLTNPTTHATVAVVEDPEAMLVLRYVLSPDQTLVGSYENNSVYLWDTHTGQRLPDMEMEGAVNSILFSRDGTLLFVTYGPIDSTNVSVWDIRAGEMIWSDDNLIDFVQDGAISPDNSQLALLGKDIPLYGNLLTGTPVHYLVDLETGVATLIEGIERGAADPAPPLLFLDDARLLVAHGTTIEMVDTATAAITRTYVLPYTIRLMKANPSLTRLAVSNREEIAIWDLEADQEVGAFAGYATTVTAAAFSPDGTHVMTVINNRLQVFDVAASTMVLDSEIEDMEISGFGYSKDVLLHQREGETVLWDYANNTVVWTHTGAVMHMNSAHTRLLLAATSGEGEAATSVAYLLDGTSGEVLSETDISGNCGWEATPDLSTMAIARTDETERAQLTLVNLDTGDTLGEIDPDGACAVEMDFSPNGQYLATIAKSASANVWSVATRELVSTFYHGHSPMNFFGFTVQTGTPAFVTDERLVTTGGGLDREEFYTWSVTEGTSLGKFTGSFGEHAYAPDGSTLYMAQFGVGVVQIRDPLTGDLRDAYFAHNDTVNKIVLSPDGTLMLTTSSDGTASVTSLDPES